MAATIRRTQGVAQEFKTSPPVGFASLGAGYWGQLDLGGNLEEWTLDWISASYVDPCVDCANLSPGSLAEREVRSVNFQTSAAYLSPNTLFATAQGSASPADQLNFVGFRCARAP
jgi:formylglycine-generating enzyme